MPGIFSHPFLVNAVEALDEDKLDREWVIRNILGGMAAGFGLRGMSSSCCHFHALDTEAF